jgi:tetratricopeptide (TPR) repeat protein
VLSRRVALLCVCALFLVSDVRAQSVNSELVQRYSQEGERALKAGRYAEAAQAYEKLRELAPKIAEVYAQLGLIYFQQKRNAEAVTVLRQAIKLKPTLPKIDLLLAMSLCELGQYEEALPALKKGFKSAVDPDLKRSSGLQLQRAYTGLQQDDKAVAVALELTQLYPNDAEVLYHAGRLFANFAYLSTVKLAQVAPDSVWLHLAAGEAYESQGQIDSAVREYKEVLTIDPYRTGIHFRLGRVLLVRAPTDAGVEAGALKEFELELQLDSTNANAAYEIGELHRKYGQLERADEFFTRAVTAYPDFEEALVGLGRTLVALGKPELALSHLRKAVALNPNDDVAYYQIARAYLALGKIDDQQKAFAEYQRLRSRRAGHSETGPFSRREATKQEIDAKPQQ